MKCSASKMVKFEHAQVLVRRVTWCKNQHILCSFLTSLSSFCFNKKKPFRFFCVSILQLLSSISAFESVSRILVPCLDFSVRKYRKEYLVLTRSCSFRYCTLVCSKSYDLLPASFVDDGCKAQLVTGRKEASQRRQRTLLLCIKQIKHNIMVFDRR